MNFATLLITLCTALAGLQEMNAVDRFMATVLANRDAGYEQLESYSFLEDETITIKTRGGRILSSRTAVYEWSARDQQLLRSPQSVDGVTVDDQEKQAYETRWLTQGRAGKRRSDITSDSFFHFSFEPGRYFFKERRKTAGRETVIVEYLPEKHFQENGRDPIGSRGDRFDAGFDKTSVVEFEIDFEDQAIRQISFTNARMDYLPYGWVVEFENLDARISYMRLKGGIWVPQTLRLHTEFRDAESSKEIEIVRRFHDYAKPRVNVEFRVLEQDAPGQ